MYFLTNRNRSLKLSEKLVLYFLLFGVITNRNRSLKLSEKLVLYFLLFGVIVNLVDDRER